MKAGRLLHAARLHSGLSQRQLAAKARVPQPMVSLIERGAQDPRHATLERLLRACDVEVDLVPIGGGGVDRTQFIETLKAQPTERVQRLLEFADFVRRVRRSRGEVLVPLEPAAIFRILIAAEVRFVLIGGMAGTFLGSTTVTHDMDICYDRERENLDRLATALGSLRARPRDMDPSLPFKLDAQTLLNGWNFTFETTYGPLDCIAEASGGFNYRNLSNAASPLPYAELMIPVVSLDDLIRMKRAAGRNKDRIEVENLSALREVRDKRRH